MAPKKVDSCSNSFRRFFAPSWSIKPDERSASMAICLPGIESKVKRAATSAMRVEPLVITTKLTITRMIKTITPIRKLPPIIIWPNAWMILPAGSPPSCPWPRIRRVEATSRPSRNRVVTRSTVGNEVKSSGRFIKSVVIRINTADVSEMASKRSIRIAGIGVTRRRMTSTTPSANATSPRATHDQASLKLGICDGLGRTRSATGVVCRDQELEATPHRRPALGARARIFRLRSIL